MWARLIRSKDEGLIRRFNELLQRPKTADVKIGGPLSERELIQSIREQTEQHNRNNLTRTEAYFKYYQQHPEVHWALLAHMVSRNGGWSMTDVKSSLLQPILSERKARALFHMFERSNWLIFNDAYPQLLLYAESVRQGKSLFHLLPYFGVSQFMTSVWQQFWKVKDSALLTVALIVNEQQYIEQRVIQHSNYKKTVLQTAAFKLQTAFDFNQVVFPVGINRRPYLVGRTMHSFANVSHRIKTGRMLYRMLFHPGLHEHIDRWANHHPHTGSRTDYWPERFTAVPSLRSEKVYSPVLHDAWPDVRHRPAEKGDWYDGMQSLEVILTVPEYNETNFDITDTYERSYRRLKIATLFARVLRFK